VRRDEHLARPRQPRAGDVGDEQGGRARDRGGGPLRGAAGGRDRLVARGAPQPLPAPRHLADDPDHRAGPAGGHLVWLRRRAEGRPGRAVHLLRGRGRDDPGARLGRPGHDEPAAHEGRHPPPDPPAGPPAQRAAAVLHRPEGLDHLRLRVGDLRRVRRRQPGARLLPERRKPVRQRGPRVRRGDRDGGPHAELVRARRRPRAHRHPLAPTGRDRHVMVTAATDRAGALLEVRSLAKTFTREGVEPLLTLDGVDLSAQPGAFVAVIGPSAFMPQRDGLLPWRRTIDNVTIGLELAGVRRAAARERARPLLERFGLGGFETAWPWHLSGGRRPRAAFLRTVRLGKPTMRLDEPFGALDGITRSELQQWLLEVWSEVGSTVALITHDVAEAVFLADRVY